MTVEASFDGLVGPTHNYAGLSHGNLASQGNVRTVSRPREAARQGLQKARFLADLGLVQGVLPPQERPHVPTLRRLGFTGSDARVIADAHRVSPLLAAQVSSASSMWAANAATVTPSADAADARVHFTVANLAATFHRSIEPAATRRALERVFPDRERFAVHGPLPSGGRFGDEGAANHMRLEGADGRGFHVFVYGVGAFGDGGPAPARYPARQSRDASEAVSRLGRLPPERTCFVRQSPAAIDAGVFHNDVIAVAHRQVLLRHERAFAAGDEPVQVMRTAVEKLEDVVVRDEEASLDEVVRSYLFNSQLVTFPSGKSAIVAPIECHEREVTRRVVERIVAESSISAAHYLDVRQSMQNGGGPACLRLCVPLTQEELAAVNPRCILDAERHQELRAWIDRSHRDELRPDDLADPALLLESRRALDELTGILGLGGDFYEFQRP